MKSWQSEVSPDIKKIKYKKNEKLKSWQSEVSPEEEKEKFEKLTIRGKSKRKNEN